MNQYKVIAIMIKDRKIASLKHPILSVAPMIDWTDRHCRYFHRLLSPHALLYTEMITTGAILNGDRHRYLEFSPAEHPVALQLGGSDPTDLATCAKIGEDFGYDMINLNCGCPSDRVQKGKFGACLMAEPNLVADCIAEMQSAVSIPVTVKSRIGIDNSEDYEFLREFIVTIKSTNCDAFIIHARKAWLKGLSPKENREIPPLRYDIVERLKQEFPNLTIILNGGLTTIDQIKKEALLTLDGVMIGREAYQNPFFLAELEHEFFGTAPPDRFEICQKMFEYIKTHNTNPHGVTRHMLGLFNGFRGARHFRQILSTDIHNVDQPIEKTFENALSRIQ
jgi:tRNA-dihydrouridine synthase A